MSGAGTNGQRLERALARIREAPAERPFIVAQLGQSLDGRIATVSGESQWINNASALDHLHRLRAAVDAVMVGIGTVLADDPSLNVRRVPGRNPARVVIDPAGRLPAGAKCLADDGQRRVVLRGVSAPVPAGVEELVVARVNGLLPPHEIAAALHRRGLGRVLLEGGAATISTFIDAGAVDRLHVLVAPMILGSGKTGLSLKPISRLADALRPPADVHVLADGDVLFDCDLKAGKER